MDIRDSQRIKEIRDNTAKMADAFTRIADALERLTEPKDEPKTKCDTCKTYWNCQGQCDEMPQIEDEPQIKCPKCGRSDYIREFGKDFSVTVEEAGFKYKCINCNTYIEPQADCIPFDPLVEMDIKQMVEARLAQTKGMSNEDR